MLGKIWRNLDLRKNELSVSGYLGIDISLEVLIPIATGLKPIASFHLDDIRIHILFF